MRSLASWSLWRSFLRLFFSIIAGVDPKVGLYASFCIAVVISFVGGRSGMISAATGAMALLMVTLVKDNGLQYLLAAILLTGVIQIIFGYIKLGSLMRFVSRSVVTGFVNALAILIFMAQLPELTNVTWHVYAMTAADLGIMQVYCKVSFGSIACLAKTESQLNHFGARLLIYARFIPGLRTFTVPMQACLGGVSCRPLLLMKWLVLRRHECANF